MRNCQFHACYGAFKVSQLFASTSYQYIHRNYGIFSSPCVFPFIHYPYHFWFLCPLISQRSFSILAHFDRVVWNISKKRNFEVKTFYKALVCHEAAYFPWKGIWHVKVPKRVAFFVWTAALGKILTHDNLRRRGIVVVEWCVMCKKHGESVDHLFLHCDVARVVWSYFYSLFGVEWVMPSSVLDLLSGCGTLLGRGFAIRIWKQVPLCVL